MTCGVYSLTAPNGHRYVGSSASIERRVHKHARYARRGAHENSKLNRAWAKHGDLTPGILLVCRPCDLILYEQLCLDALRPEYNCSSIAGRVEFTPEVRAKLAAASRGKSPSAVTRAKMSAAKKAGVVSEETRRRMGDAGRGRLHTPQAKAKMSVAKLGGTLTEEHRRKVSASLMGNTRTLGYAPTAETRARLSAAGLGKKHSEETKRRIGESGRLARVAKLKAKP